MKLFENQSIVLVDENKEAIQKVKASLEKDGLTVYDFATGEAAILFHSNSHLDLKAAIINVNSPLLSNDNKGKQLSFETLCNTFYPEIPVLLYSDQDDGELQQYYEQNLCDDFIAEQDKRVPFIRRFVMEILKSSERLLKAQDEHDMSLLTGRIHAEFRGAILDDTVFSALTSLETKKDLHRTVIVQRINKAFDSMHQVAEAVQEKARRE